MPKSFAFALPCSCEMLKVSTVPPGNAMFVASWKTATRSGLRRPGPESPPHAVFLSPSMAKLMGPVTRLFVLPSWKPGSNGSTG